MTTAHDMLPSELGEAAAEGLDGILRRSVGGASVTSLVEDSAVLEWKAIADSDWHNVGMRLDEESASIRDLAAVAKVWGRYQVPLPYLETVLARRHSDAAASWEGPVTYATPVATLASGRGHIAYGHFPGIGYVTSLDGKGTVEIELAGVTNDSLDLAAHAVEADFETSFSAEAAREVAIVAAAEVVGAASRLLDDAVAYAKERRQFAKPIGVNQAVKHSLANGLIALERADTAVVWGSLHENEAFRGASAAIEDSIFIAETAVQVHGGIGFTWEMGLHFPLRRMMRAREVVSALAIYQPNA